MTLNIITSQPRNALYLEGVDHACKALANTRGEVAGGICDNLLDTARRLKSWPPDFARGVTDASLTVRLADDD